MPLVLKEILVDDQDMIVRQMHIPRIPARFTVSDIIRQVKIFHNFVHFPLFL